VESQEGEILHCRNHDCTNCAIVGEMGIWTKPLARRTLPRVRGAAIFSATRFRLISGSVGLPFVFERGTAAFSFAAAMTIDLIFTFFPSRKAASVSPIEALRYE
jgi:ABC-type lipoprotein release transport system permease subunit